MHKMLACSLFSILAPLAAVADDAAAPADSLAGPNCTQPPLPGAAAASNEATRIAKPKGNDFNAQLQAYQVCMKAYVDAQSALSKQHIAAANAAVKQLNDFAAQVNDAR